MRLRETQANQTMLDMDFGEGVKDRLFELGRDRRWLCDETGISESMLSKFLSGSSTPSLEQVLQVEAALDLRAGHFLRRAGYISDASDMTLEDMITYDLRLTPDQRRSLLQIVGDLIAGNIAVPAIETSGTLRAARNKGRR